MTLDTNGVEYKSMFFFGWILFLYWHIVYLKRVQQRNNAIILISIAELK